MDVGIMKQHTTIPWSKLWGNPHAVWSSEELKQPGLWLFVISYIPTTEKPRYNEVPRTIANTAVEYTFMHRLTDCSEGAEIWRWNRSRIAIILRMHLKYILPKWPLRPSYHLGHHRGNGKFCGSSPK